jgi:dTDP-4-amino-4,6-dideoxygalactose transaminase
MSGETAISLPSDQDASGRDLGDEEIALLREVVASGILTSTKGTAVKRLEAGFADLYGMPKAVACSSGTAAVHAAVAAVDPEPGEEVITTSVTDMGALTPLLYQGAVPVFADVDAVTGNVTADSIEAVISDRTRAIVVTHLFGLPADMTAIMALADARRIPVIEDCAQAYLARHGGQLVGTFGTVGCFSLQQGKHITCGEGGLLISPDAALARHMELWVNKGWGYGDPEPDHRWIAGNARLTDLQGAVALAQLAKLQGGVDNRIAMAAALSDRLAGLPGLTLPGADDGDVHSYWRYPLHVDPDVVPGGPVAVAQALKEWAVPAAPRYIQKPAFRCGIFRDQKTLGSSRFPFSLARPEALDYADARFPGTLRYLETVLVLPWSERLTEEHIAYVAKAITAAVEQ